MQFIKEIILRNRRKIYKDGSVYKVVGIDRKGVNYTTTIENRVINYAKEKFKGKALDTEDAFEIIQADASRLRLPYSYGHKLKYYVQDILLVLVALETASFYKEGKKYIYKVI